MPRCQLRQQVPDARCQQVPDANKCPTNNLSLLTSQIGTLKLDASFNGIVGAPLVANPVQLWLLSLDDIFRGLTGAKAPAQFELT